MAESCETATMAAAEPSTDKQDGEAVVRSERAPATTRKYQTVVTCVRNPAKFWVRFGEAKVLKDFEGYLATLNEWCSLQKGSLIELPKLRSYIAVKLDTCWHRAQVLDISSDERLSVYCIDTGVSAEVGVDQICAKQMPILTQQPSQAIQCCLADIATIENDEWSEAAIERFKCLVQNCLSSVYLEFETIKLVEGQTRAEVLLFVSYSNSNVLTGTKSVGKILSEEGLAQYTGESDDGVTKMGEEENTLTTEPVTAGRVNQEAVNYPLIHTAQGDESSEDDVVVEDTSSGEEKPLSSGTQDVKSGLVACTSTEVLSERMAESEQVIGPSHLVENRNSFNIVSRTTHYSSSSSDSDGDAWDESLLAPVRPKPAAGLFVKADVEKDMQKRKALHAKFNQFISTPLPPPASSDRHPVGSRGRRGGRRGSQGVGRYGTAGRGNRPPQALSGWSSDRTFYHGNQARGGAHRGRTLLSSPMQSFTQQQQFPQQQFPQQQFPQQQFPQQQFPQQQFPQQQLPQQQSLQQPIPQQQHFPQQGPQYRFPPPQFLQQQFPQQQASPPRQDQPRYSLLDRSPIKSTPQVTGTGTTSLSQLDEKGMKNEYEWQKWMIERSVKRALDGLSDETVINFTSQIQKILSDSAATTLNQFPSSKGATWVVVRTLISHAVDKPVDCSKAIIALVEVYNTFPDEMTQLLAAGLQDCSEQVLKELTTTNTQCRHYCNLVSSLHSTVHSATNTSLQALTDSSLEHLLQFWTEYSLDTNISELGCEGCTDCIVILFTDVSLHMVTNNRPLLDKCVKAVRSLILSSLPVKCREKLLDFYVLLVTKEQPSRDMGAVTDLSLVDVTVTSQSNAVTLHHLSGDSDQCPVKTDQSCVKPPLQSMVKTDQSPLLPNQDVIKTNQSMDRPDQSVTIPDQTHHTPDHRSEVTVSDTAPSLAVAVTTQSQDGDVVLTSSSTNTTLVVSSSKGAESIDPYQKVCVMLNTLGLSHLLENFKAAIIQDNVLSCDPTGLKEAMKDAGVPSGAVLSIMHYLSRPENNVAMVFPPTQPYYQLPVHHSYPTAPYSLPSVHAAYLQQQPHPLAAQFSSLPTLNHSHQISGQAVGISSPTHLLPTSLVHSWDSSNIITQVSTGPRP